MLHVRQWSIRLPLLTLLLAAPAFANSEPDAIDGFFTYVGCMLDGAGAGANPGFAHMFCTGHAYNMPF